MSLKIDRFPKTYPKLAAPVFSIQPPTPGLKSHQLPILLNEINSKVHAMKDVEMVFDVRSLLCSMVDTS